MLHQVSMSGGAPVDSARTDRGGRYRVRAPARDSAAVYIVSVTYAGIAYFTRPLHALRGAALDTAEALALYDTSSTSPAVSLAQRHMIVRHPETDGSHAVLELLVLHNPGTWTRLAPDTSRPVWQGALPQGAIRLEVGESDVSSEAVYRRGDSIAVAAAIPPGDKQVVVQYVLPRSSRGLDLTLDQTIGRINVLLEDTAATLEGNALERVGIEAIEGTTFVRFERRDAAPGARVMVRFPSAGFAAGSWWWLVVGMAGLAMAAGLVVAWRRTSVAAARATSPSDAEVIAAQIAALDAAFENGGDATAADRAAYQRRRAALKARLEELLSRFQA